MDLVDLAVIGAGPAGSALAMRVASAGWRVMLLDKDAFPRDKLCGEFLSPESRAYLEDLGLEAPVAAARPATITHLRIALHGANPVLRELPAPGRGLSRRMLDLLLANRATESGAEFLARHHVRAARERPAGYGTARESLFELRVDQPAGPRLLHARAVADASGLAGRRRARPVARRDPGAFVAVQTHMIAIPADERSDDHPGCVELFPFDGGYCGVNEIEGGRATICALATRTRWKRDAARPAAFMAGVARENAWLGARLGQLSEGPGGWLASSACGAPAHDSGATAQGSSATVTGGGARALAIGDAGAMIAPACGDGISMALRSAELGAASILAYLAGEDTWKGSVSRFEHRWRGEIAGRLRVGRCIHEVLLRPGPARLLLMAATGFPPLTSLLFRSSRG